MHKPDPLIILSLPPLHPGGAPQQVPSEHLQHVMLRPPLLPGEFLYLLYAPKCAIVAHQGWRSALGYAPPEVSGALAGSMIHPDEQERALAVMRSLKQQAFRLLQAYAVDDQTIPSHMLQMEYRVRKADGSWTRVRRTTCVLSFDHQQEVEYTLTFCQDIPFGEADRPLCWRLCGPDMKTLPIELPEESHLNGCPLRPREREVLRLVAAKLTSGAIGERLFLSKHTVDTHRRKIIEKLMVRDSEEAVSLARRKGWI
jgi:DNA-binding CsgD family transcriptional regulator